MPPRRSAPLPLLLLPGTLCDERVFAPLLAGVRARVAPASLDATVVMTPHCTTMRDAAEAVLAAAPPRSALLGFSLGGIVALEIALLAPERVSGLALLDVNAGPAPASIHAARRDAVVQAQTVGHARYVREALWPKYVATRALAQTSLQSLLADMAEALGHEAFHAQTEAALSRPDYRLLLHRITAPTVVIAGEHDELCPAAAQRAMAQALPNAQFTPVADAGHFALLEQQDAVAASVAAWFHHLSDEHQAPQPAQEQT